MLRCVSIHSQIWFPTTCDFVGAIVDSWSRPERRGFWKRSVISLLAMESRNSQEPDISFWFFPVLGFFGPRLLSWPTFIGYQLTKTLNTQTTARSFLAVRHLAWQFDGHCLALVTIWFPMSMFLFLPGAKKSHCLWKGDLKSSPLWLPQGFLPQKSHRPG